MPVLLTAAYTARNPVVELGPANLSALRLLVLVGVVRVLLRGERPAHGLNAIDGWLLAWTVCLVGTSLFHTSEAWTFRLGLVLGEVGVYLLCRTFVQDTDDLLSVFRVLCVALAPLAALMLLEKFTAHNYFGLMGTGSLYTRYGNVRAYGPFGHPILAGVVGASLLPMALCIWRTNRASALIGVCSALAIVFASNSSGPIMMVLFTCAALSIWKIRRWLRLIQYGTVAAIIALQIVMNDPVYFLMARIDIAGGSTGWFRAQLIRTSIEHFSEWWAVGTDYTRHWMPSGIPANQNHTDMTNHLLQMGVWGGLPLLIIFVTTIVVAFRTIGRVLDENMKNSPQGGLVVWSLGAALFGHVVNFWSISLYDQSVSFLYLVLAGIGAAYLPVPQVSADHRRARVETVQFGRQNRLPVGVVARKRLARVHARRPALTVAGVIGSHRRFR